MGFLRILLSVFLLAIGTQATAQTPHPIVAALGPATLVGHDFTGGGQRDDSYLS
jgi:hypothetical protein